MKKFLLLVIAFRFFTANAQISDAIIQQPVSVLSKGTPGPATKIIIRCGATINQENQPLFVIDGELAEGNALKNLHPANILSIHILKDATATSLYGSSAAHGVILITTKEVNEKTFFVFDAIDKTPLACATVKIADSKNTSDTFSIVAEKNGGVTSSALKTKTNYDVIVSCVGYETLRTKIQFQRNKVQPQLLLKRKLRRLDEVIIVTHSSRCIRCGGCGSICSRTYLWHDSLQPKKSQPTTVYPNPAFSGGGIIVHTPTSFSGIVQLLSTSGQILQTQIVNSKQKMIEVSLIKIPSGIYFIRLIDETTKKPFTQKLMVH